MRFLTNKAWDRYPLPEQQDLEPPFDGGVIDFQRVASVFWRDFFTLQPLYRFDDERKRDLQMRWNAHTSRRGPLVAAQGALDLAKMLTSNSAAELASLREDADATAKLDHDVVGIIDAWKGLSYGNWLLEGPPIDELAERLNSDGDYQAVARRILKALHRVRSDADQFIDVLEAALTKRTTR